jgi:hypothetical protein
VAAHLSLETTKARLMPIFPAAWEVEIGRIMFEVSLSKKLMSSHLNEKAGRGGTHLSYQRHGRYR